MLESVSKKTQKILENKDNLEKTKVLERKVKKMNGMLKDILKITKELARKKTPIINEKNENLNRGIFSRKRRKVPIGFRNNGSCFP